jgi:hypothetical protein
MEEVFLHIEKGKPEPEQELGWMSGVIGVLWKRALHYRRRATFRLERHIEDRVTANNAHSQCEPLVSGEIALLSSRLPAPYRQILDLLAMGRNRSEVWATLNELQSIKKNAAWSLIQTAKSMAKSVSNGIDPRMKWPQRYLASKNRWIRTLASGSGGHAGEQRDGEKRREAKGSEGKRREAKGSEGKRREAKGSEGKRREGAGHNGRPIGLQANQRPIPPSRSREDFSGSAGQ